MCHLETNNWAVYIYNRKQDGKPLHCWSYEKSPVTEVTGRGNQRIEDSKTASGIGVGRKNDQPWSANLHGYWGLVPLLLNIQRKDSLYVCTGEAVSYNCQTARVWRLWVSPPVLSEMAGRGFYFFLHCLFLRSSIDIIRDFAYNFIVSIICL